MSINDPSFNFFQWKSQSHWSSSLFLYIRNLKKNGFDTFRLHFLEFSFYGKLKAPLNLTTKIWRKLASL